MMDNVKNVRFHETMFMSFGWRYIFKSVFDDFYLFNFF